MEIRYEIEKLTKDFVYVNKIYSTEIDGKVYDVKKETTSYINSPNDRELIVQELPPDIYGAILLVWGDTPTKTDAPNPQDEGK